MDVVTSYPLSGRLRVSHIVKACCMTPVEFIGFMLKTKPPTKAMARGVLLHGLVLENKIPDTIIQFEDFKTKDARLKRDQAMADGLFPVSAAAVKAWSSVVDPVLCAEFYGYEIEKPLFATLEGFGPVQGRLDAHKPKLHVKDYKTTTASFFKRINANIYKYGYDIQLYLYMLLCGAPTGEIVLMDCDTGCWKSIMLEAEKIEDACQARLVVGVQNIQAWSEYQNKGSMRQPSEDYCPPHGPFMEGYEPEPYGENDEPITSDTDDESSQAV